MTGTDLCVNKPNQSRSYLNHLVLIERFVVQLYKKVKQSHYRPGVARRVLGS